MVPSFYVLQRWESRELSQTLPLPSSYLPTYLILVLILLLFQPHHLLCQTLLSIQVHSVGAGYYTNVRKVASRGDLLLFQHSFQLKSLLVALSASGLSSATMARGRSTRATKAQEPDSTNITQRLPRPAQSLSASQFVQQHASDIVVDQQQSFELVKTIICASVSMVHNHLHAFN